MTVYELDRNDVEAAAKMYREAAMSSSTADQFADVVATLLQLQDDPTELERRMDQVAAEPTVAAALRRLGVDA